MLFTDDSYLYYKATMNEAFKVCQLLKVFEAASGQQVNRNKSSIFFSKNTSQKTRGEVCMSMEMSETAEDCKYLDLPNTMGHNKNAILGYLKERVRQRIKKWDGKFLSKSGKEVLLKTVIQALPTYAISVFLLPMEMCKYIERLMCKFWWKTKPNNNRGIHWASWERMCKPKCNGGLGFRNLHAFNMALLGKQGWYLLNHEDSIAGQVFKAKYFPQTTFLDTRLGNNSSFIWRSIWASQELIRASTRWRIGSGKTMRVI